MVLTVSTSYASGTVDTASGTMVTLATGTAVAGWVGRLFVLNRSISGRGGQWRKITAVNSSTSIEIEYDWRTGADIPAYDAESLPQTGDAFHISHHPDDIDDTTNILKVDSRLYRNVAGLTLSGNVTLFAEDLTFDFDRPTQGTAKSVTIGQTAGMIFGNYNRSRKAELGCLLLFDYSTVTGVHDIFGTSGSPGGDLIWNSCVVRTLSPSIIGSSQGPFMRLNRGSTAINRIVGCSLNGCLSGRFSGSRTAIQDNVFSRGLGNFTTFTTEGTLGDISGNLVNESVQAFYWLWTTSGSGRVDGLNALNISDSVVTIANLSSGSTSNELELSNLIYDQSATNFLYIFNSAATSQTVINKTVKTTFSLRIYEFIGSALNAGGSLVFFDAFGTQSGSYSSTGGVFEEQRLTRRIYNCNTSGLGAVLNISLNDESRSTLYAPYLGRFREYGKLELEQSFAAETPYESFNWYKSTDAQVTESIKATVDAYTGFSYNSGTETLTLTEDRTNAQIYDRTRSYLVDNMDVPQFGAFTKLANRLSWDWDLALSVALSSGGVIAFDGDTLDLSVTTTQSRVFEIGSTSTVTVADGTTNLSAWTFANGATINLRSGATAAEVIVGTGQDANITAGAGVIIESPTNSIVISGIPAVTNAILAVTNLTTDTVSYPTLTGGGAIIPLDAGTNYEFAADAPGYLRQAVTLPGNTPTFEFGLTNYRALYDAGISRSADIAFNYSTLAVTISDGTANLSFADVFRTIEDYLATESGVLFPNPPFPVIVDVGGGNGRNYLFFPYDDANDQVNPVRIRPDPTNTIDPTLTDFVIVLEGATAPLFDIFDFTSAGGRTIRFQTEAVAANITLTAGSSGNTLNPDLPELNISLGPDRTGLTITAILIEDNAAVGTPIVCTESATVPGHYSGDMPAVPAGVYGVRFLSAGTQVGTGVIDWDGTKERGLGDVPTVAQVEARTLPSADYFVVGDYTPPPDISGLLTSAAYASSLPANFGDLAITVTSGLVTATNPGTGATAADVWAYAGRTLDGTQAANLASIASIPTNPLLTIDARLNTLDATISSRSTYDGSDTFGVVTLLERLTALRAGYLDKLDVTGTLAHSDAAATYRADVSGLLTAAAYTAPLDAAATQAATSAAIAAYTVPTLAQVQAAGFTVDRDGALTATRATVLALSKRQGLEAGISATVLDAAEGSPGSLTTSDGAINQVLTLNANGSVTIENAPN